MGIEDKEAFLRTAVRFKKMNFGEMFTDVSHGEFVMMQMLRDYMAKNPGKKDINVSEIARQQGISSPAVSRTLRSLEEKGYIHREVNERDRRNTYVYLTPAGENKSKETAKIIDDFMMAVIDRLGEDKFKRLVGLWNELADIAQDELGRRGQKRERSKKDAENS